ncbi:MULTISPECIES: TetR/AcrR family transcriptional regulator [unclassified Streptomyces]|uniref:TetR/AcrR family transcriptional regulator n=1 Tax=unclassified Streptomyces TaxID=2593676 RepID=UPI00074A0A0A|nr:MULTISPECIES: TetR/AcrR family transcriptional regulator [unclassified Streptomyces]KUL71177.1 TetR family transcriptional regulator [Streptomyces sp. NRRL WC-3604]KUL76907.1 TetR family transcriptional regulator [Streptomyces sp. NRRL WC-3605]
MTTRDTADSPRRRIVEAAVELLETGGPDAVSTRAVASAAGMQPPAIYRLFGDKEGLLEAVAEHGYAQFLESKRALLDPAPKDAVEDLRRAWDTVVEFGVSRPELFAVMTRATGRGADQAHRAGLEMLYGRVRRLAAAGWLRVDEELAAQIIQATGRGAVTTWHSTPAERRTPALLTALREATIAAVTHAEPTVPATESGPAGAARALRAALPDETDVLSDAERRLLREWLTRLAADGGAPQA